MCIAVVHTLGWLLSGYLCTKPCDLSHPRWHHSIQLAGISFVCLVVAMLAPNLQRMPPRNLPEVFWKPSSQAPKESIAPSAAFGSFAVFGLHDGRVCIAKPKPFIQRTSPLASCALHRRTKPARWRDSRVSVTGHHATHHETHGLTTRAKAKAKAKAFPGALGLRHLSRLLTVIS